MVDILDVGLPKGHDRVGLDQVLVDQWVPAELFQHDQIARSVDEEMISIDGRCSFQANQLAALVTPARLITIAVEIEESGVAALSIDQSVIAACGKLLLNCAANADEVDLLDGQIPV